MRPERRPAIDAFLAAAGWSGAEPRPLAGDASFRSYYRLNGGERCAVLMDAPPDKEDVRPFVRIARHLHGLGLSAPAILAEDGHLGLLLLEDFGDDTYTRLLNAGADPSALYATAVDVLIHLHTLPAAAVLPAETPAYDEKRLLDEALLLTDWFLPAVSGVPTGETLQSSYIAAWRSVLTGVLRGPTTLVLRDFHVDNLMRLPGREGAAACGLLDFQDAVIGSPAYDLMSLLEDARRDVPAEVKAAMLDRYLAAAPVADSQAFLTAFAVLAAQRHAKVIGIFTRLYRRDGKPIYLGHIPRVWRLLEAALRHPALAVVAAWFERHVPPPLRISPPR